MQRKASFFLSPPSCSLTRGRGRVPQASEERSPPLHWGTPASHRFPSAPLWWLCTAGHCGRVVLWLTGTRENGGATFLHLVFCFALGRTYGGWSAGIAPVSSCITGSVNIGSLFALTLAVSGRGTIFWGPQNRAFCCGSFLPWDRKDKYKVWWSEASLCTQLSFWFCFVRRDGLPV